VIATYTGETVWKFTKRVGSIIRHTPGYCVTRSQPEIEFLAVIKEDWLSNIHTVSLPLIPFIAFSNFAEAVKGNLVIDGLLFNLHKLIISVCKHEFVNNYSLDMCMECFIILYHTLPVKHTSYLIYYLHMLTKEN